MVYSLNRYPITSRCDEEQSELPNEYRIGNYYVLLAGKIMGIVDLVLLAFCCTIAGLYLEETNHSEESQEFCFFLCGVFISIGTRGMFSTMGFSKSTCEFSGDTSSFWYDLYTTFR